MARMRRAAPSDAMGDTGGNGHSMQMPNDNSAGLADPNDRGMPGVSKRSPHGDMAPGRMDEGAGIAGDSMPGAGMGGGGGGGMRCCGGNGGGDFGANRPQVRRCGTMEVHRRLLSTVPEYARIRDDIENHALRYETGEISAQRTGITRIPVVVHVVWNAAAQNISDAQIASQIDVLNRDFRRANPDVSVTPAPFLPLATDSRVEFVLANTDPTGAPSQRHRAAPERGRRVHRRRRRQVGRQRRHGRLAIGQLPQHLGLPARRRPARLRPVPRRPRQHRRRGDPALRRSAPAAPPRRRSTSAAPPPTRSATG